MRLRPGLHVVRRDDGHVQVGLDPPHRVIARADPAHLSLLHDLRHGGAVVPEDAGQERLVRALGEAGLLLGPPAASTPSDPRGAVALHDHGLGDGVDRLRELLEGSAVDVTDTGRIDLVVLCSAGPLPRAVVDPWLAEGTPHLVVSGTGVPGSVRVGPLVDPGRTACLRCVDASEAAQDPRRTLVLEQLALRSTAPVDPLTLELALAWAARDVTTFLAGERPPTWSATVDVHASAPAPRAWPRHPDCGCCWDELPY